MTIEKTLNDLAALLENAEDSTHERIDKLEDALVLRMQEVTDAVKAQALRIDRLEALVKHEQVPGDTQPTPPQVSPPVGRETLRLSEGPNLSNRSGFSLLIDVPNAPVGIYNCTDFLVSHPRWFSDCAGKLTIHGCSNFEVDKLRSAGEDGTAWSGTAFSLHNCSDFRLDHCEANVSRYAVWCENSTDFLFENCTFRTRGQESCMRFTHCSRGHTHKCDLISDLKHCWRVHGTSNDMRLTHCSLGGLGNGIMCGASPSGGHSDPNNQISDLLIEGNKITVTGPDPLNLKGGIVTCTVRGNTATRDVFGYLGGRAGFVVVDNTVL